MRFKRVAFFLCMVFAALSSEAVFARDGHGHRGHHHGGVRWGVHIGVPFGWYYPPSYWYGAPWYNPPVFVQSPPVYIERGTAPAEPDDDAYYWYHCSRPEGYYPYIKECPGGWKKVVPTPPQSQ